MIIDNHMIILWIHPETDRSHRMEIPSYNPRLSVLLTQLSIIEYKQNVNIAKERWKSRMCLEMH